MPIACLSRRLSRRVLCTRVAVLCGWVGTGGWLSHLAYADTGPVVAGSQKTAAPLGGSGGQVGLGVQGRPADVAALGQPMRGVSMQAHVGGGYMAAGRKIGANQTYPQLVGQSEMLGAGPTFDVSLGVDVLSFMAVQVTAGMTYAGARRAEYVHSLSQAYGGIGVRFVLPLDARWVVNLAPALAYFHQDNLVEEATSGIGILAAVGLEYFAHVRHFSAGADLSLQAPLAPTRLFIGLMPHVRYTF